MVSSSNHPGPRNFAGIERTRGRHSSPSPTFPSPTTFSRPSQGQFDLASQFGNQLHAPPITPPPIESDSGLQDEKIFSTATHVLSTESAAVQSLSRLYETDTVCRRGLVRAVEAIVDSQRKGGKIIVIGVGKSGKIGEKLVATMNSLGLMSIFLHPVEALHGDLGIVRANDVVLLITFSGKTPELLQLLPHLSTSLPLIALTSHTSYHTLPLIRDRDDAILLPAPITESEVSSFGVAAPTTSTTVAMVLGDALALTAAKILHGADELGPKEVFRKNHPGGAIGMGNMMTGQSIGGAERIRVLAVLWSEIPIADHVYEQGDTEMTPPSPALSETSSECDIDLWSNDSSAGVANNSNSSNNNRKACYSLSVMDCLRIAVKSRDGWLRISDGGIIPPNKLLSCQSLTAEVNSPGLGLVLDVNGLIKFPADYTVREVARKLLPMRRAGEVTDETVIAIVENGQINGVVVVGDIPLL